MNVSEAYLQLCRQNYRAYVYHVHHGLWKPGRAISFVCDKVQEFVERKTDAPYEILAISLPPQHGKSMAITETLPSWALGRHPLWRVIEISYSEDFAVRFGRRNMAKVEEFGNLFNIKLADSPRNATDFELSNHVGGMISRGITSGVTGQPCNLMIIDDPIKNQMEADSETYRERIHNEWISSFRTRLAPGAKVILIQTRWHEDDLAGRLIDQEPNIEVLNLPCEAEDNDPLGRAVGDSLAPEIGKDNNWLVQFKAAYSGSQGTRAWNALFQGRPTSAEGNLLKREWWQYYGEAPEMMETILSVDATFKDGKNNDYVAIQAWGKRDANCYLLDAIKKHMDFPETVEAIRAMKAKWPKARLVLVEDKANGSAIIQVLRREIPGILAVNPEGGKVARANAVSGSIEAGNVWLPKYGAFTADFVEECAAFPTGAHDDQVDAMTQALNRLIYFGAKVPVVEDKIFNFEFEKPKPKPGGQGEKVRII